MDQPRDQDRSYPTQPHSSRRVNTIHHTVCWVRHDVTNLELNIPRRRPGMYAVPMTSHSILKPDAVVSRRLRARLCSASRVYCGNNMLDLHKKIYQKPRPVSVQYKWSPPSVTLALPKIEREQVRARTAGVVRFRNSGPDSTFPGYKRLQSYPVISTTQERAQKQENKENKNDTDDNEVKNPDETPTADDTETTDPLTKDTPLEHSESPAENSEGKVAQNFQSGKPTKLTESREKQRKAEKSREKVPKKKKKRKTKRREVKEQDDVTKTDALADNEGTQTANSWFSKRRGLNSDDDYVTDNSEDENP